MTEELGCEEEVICLQVQKKKNFGHRPLGDEERKMFFCVEKISFFVGKDHLKVVKHLQLLIKKK